MAEFFEVINGRNSVRGYSDEKLTEAEIKQLVEAGLKAPTARNEQELHFTVIDTCNEIVKEIGMDINPDNPLGFVYNAPTLIIISGKDDFGWTGVDAGISVENIHLASYAMGLGSVIIGCISGVLTGEKKDYYNRKLDIPEGYSYKIAIAVGHPTMPKQPHESDYGRDVSIV